MHNSNYYVFNIDENDVGIRRNLTFLPGHLRETDTCFGEQVFSHSLIFSITAVQ